MVTAGSMVTAGRMVTAERGQRLLMHEWDVLGTASVASSHCDGAKVPWVAVQSRGPRSTHCEAYLLPAGQPRHMRNVCGFVTCAADRVLACICR